LKKNVGKTLADGLAETILQSPPDPVDYLGKWLLNYVKLQKEAAQEKAELSKAQKDWEVYASQAEVSKAAADSKAAQAQKTATKHQAYLKVLKFAKSDRVLLDWYCTYLADVLGVSSVYFGKKFLRENDELITYISTTPSQKFLFGKMMKNSGVTFKIFKKQEEQSEDEAKSKEAPLVYIPNVFTGPHAKSIHFHDKPKPGGYLWELLQYKVALTEGTFYAALPKILEIMKTAETVTAEVTEKKKVNEEKQKEIAAEIKDLKEEMEEEEEEKAGGEEAEKEGEKEESNDGADAEEAKESGEEEIKSNENEAKLIELEAKLAELKSEEYASIPDWKTEIFSQITMSPCNLLLCVDTLGSPLRQFSEAEIDTIKKTSAKLVPSLEQINKKMFIAEFERYFALKKLDEESVVDDASQKREIKAALEAKIKEALEDQEEGKEKSEGYIVEGFEYSESEIAFHQFQPRVLALSEQIMDIKNYVVLKKPLIEVLEAFLLFHGKKDLYYEDKTTSVDMMKFQISESLIEDVKRFDPRTTPVEDLEKIESLLAGKKIETIRSMNYPISEIFGYLEAGVASRKKVEEEEEARRKAEEEAEAQRKAEEEAKKLEEEAKKLEEAAKQAAAEEKTKEES